MYRGLSGTVSVVLKQARRTVVQQNMQWKLALAYYCNYNEIAAIYEIIVIIIIIIIVVCLFCIFTY